MRLAAATQFVATHGDEMKRRLLFEFQRPFSYLSVEMNACTASPSVWLASESTLIIASGYVFCDLMRWWWNLSSCYVVVLKHKLRRHLPLTFRFYAKNYEFPSDAILQSIGMFIVIE